MNKGIEHIFELLEARRLKEALVQLEAICMQTNDWLFRNRIESIQTSYNYMLQYAQQGIHDPNRTEIYNNFIRSTYELTQFANIITQLDNSAGVYYEHIRTFRQHPALSYSELQVRLESFTEDISTVSLLYHDKNVKQEKTRQICIQHESAINELFNKTWVNLQWNETEFIEAQNIIDSALISSNDKAVFISAMTLALTHIFDERKMLLLIHSYKNEDTQVSQRALIGLIMMIDIYEKHIKLYPKLLSQLTLLQENSQFASHLYNIQMQLLMTQETEKVTQKMHEDIIPGIMKNAKLKDGELPFEEHIDGEDFNPEWIDNSDVNDKIKEMGELQMEGADVYMGTFATLKNFPFFNQVSHWFYPFDIYQNDLLPFFDAIETNNLSPISLIIHSDTFCNSDKYSFCLSMTQMPENLREQTLKQLMNESEMTEEQKSSIQKLIDSPQSSKSISRQYIQDLYRFSKIWRSRHARQEHDFFNRSLCLWNKYILSASFVDLEKIKSIADFLFSKGRYDQSYELYNRLVKETSATAEIYQRLGYIEQKRKIYDQAIINYEKADILIADNVWTLKHLAFCHKQKGELKKALSYYKRVESILPDDLSVTMQIGECLVKKREFEQALSYFYKVEYLGKDPIPAQRAIAWCNFCIGKHKEAFKYYQSVLKEEQPQKQDWLNMGHAYWVNGEIQKAIECYSKAKEFYKEHAEFIHWFMGDAKYLHKYNISKEDIQIILDLLI